NSSLGNNIQAVRVSSAGVGLGGTVVATTSGLNGAASVAYNGTNFLVAYTSNGNPVQAKRMSPAGAVLDASPITVRFSTVVNTPAVSVVGTQWLVGWNEATDVHAARIAATGTVLDVGGFVVASAAGNQNLVDASSDGTNYWLAWLDNRANGYSSDLYGA